MYLSVSLVCMLSVSVCIFLYLYVTIFIDKLNKFSVQIQIWYIQIHTNTYRYIPDTGCMYLVCICLYLSRLYLNLSECIVHAFICILCYLSVSDVFFSIMCVYMCVLYLYVSVLMSKSLYVVSCMFLHAVHKTFRLLHGNRRHVLRIF